MSEDSDVKITSAGGTRTRPSPQQTPDVMAQSPGVRDVWEWICASDNRLTSEPAPENIRLGRTDLALQLTNEAQFSARTNLSFDSRIVEPTTDASNKTSINIGGLGLNATQPELSMAVRPLGLEAHLGGPSPRSGSPLPTPVNVGDEAPATEPIISSHESRFPFWNAVASSCVAGCITSGAVQLAVSLGFVKIGVFGAAVTPLNLFVLSACCAAILWPNWIDVERALGPVAGRVDRLWNQLLTASDQARRGYHACAGALGATGAWISAHRKLCIVGLYVGLWLYIDPTAFLDLLKTLLSTVWNASVYGRQTLHPVTPASLPR